jgi:hypothetical protein
LKTINRRLAEDLQKKKPSLENNTKWESCLIYSDGQITVLLTERWGIALSNQKQENKAKKILI